MSDNHKEKPICLAVIICEKIITDVRTHNKTFVEVFQNVFAREVPSRVPAIAINISLTNILGATPLTIRCIGPEMNQVFEMQATADSNNPTLVADISLNLPGLKLDQFGTYHINVLAREDLIGGRSFSLVQQAEKEKNG